jgi:hypothetical protein
MYKFIFLVLLVYAFHPDWPTQSIAAAQEIIKGFQSDVIVVSHNK